jgi:hypothetical protein
MSYSRVRLGLTPAFSILPWFLRIGGFAGVNQCTALFHSSLVPAETELRSSPKGTPLLLSLAPHVPELAGATPEIGVKPLTGGKAPRGSWYEPFITHPHDENFWTQLDNLLCSLKPGKYFILLQPQFQYGTRTTLGTCFLTDNNPDMQALREHFEPFIVQQEEDYNDKFVSDTRVNLLNVSKDDIISQASSRRVSPNTQVLEAIHTLVQSQNTTLEAIKALASAPPQPPLNWQPIIQAVISGVAQSFGAQVSFPVSSTSQQTPAASAPVEAQVAPALEAKLDKLSSTVARFLGSKAGLRPCGTQGQAQTIVQLSQTVDTLSQGFNSLSQTIAQQGKILELLASKKTSNNDSNGSSTPPSSPSALGTPVSTPPWSRRDGAPL